MIEILDRLDVLARPDLDLAALSLAGVPFGSVAADAIDRCRISELGYSPLAYRDYSGGDRAYLGADGRPVPFAEVVDGVLHGDGALLAADEITYNIDGGVVTGFAMYGVAPGHLDHFGFLRSYDEFLELFGKPDRAEERYDTGELMGYSNYYWTCRKNVFWDSWDDRVSLVNLGDFEGNSGP